MHITMSELKKNVMFQECPNIFQYGKDILTCIYILIVNYVRSKSILNKHIYTCPLVIKSEDNLDPKEWIQI